MSDHSACQHLHDALADARSQLVPPNRDTAVAGYQTVHTLDAGNVTPDGDPALMAEIETLEQAIRDAGCNP